MNKFKYTMHLYSYDLLVIYTIHLFGYRTVTMYGGTSLPLSFSKMMPR